MDIEKYKEEIDAAFGESRWALRHVSDTQVEISNDIVKVTLGYDKRDQIIDSLIEPLGVPSEICEECQPKVLLKMLGYMDDDEELRATSTMEISHELKILGIVIKKVFALGEDSVKRAQFFCDAYGIGYTDGINASVRPRAS
jgi:hypothetical protein